MSDRKRHAYRMLDELYRLIPEVACKGLCGGGEDMGATVCGTIPLSTLEYERIEAKVGRAKMKEMPPSGVCPLLVAGRCSVYEIRPAICRAYGAIKDAKHMRCRFGCEPVSWLSSARFFSIMRSIARIGGRTRIIGYVLPETEALHREKSTNPDASLAGWRRAVGRRIEEQRR